MPASIEGIGAGVGAAGVGAAGAGAVAGADGSGDAPPICCSINVSYMDFANSIGYICINVESTNPSICILNEIFTNLSSRNGDNSLACLTCTSTRLASGGLISIVFPSIEESDVELEPIIWFIASEIALKCNSLSSPSRFVPSPPIIRSVITLTSCSFNTNILVPLIPTVYLICMKTHGFSYASII